MHYIVDYKRFLFLRLNELLDAYQRKLKDCADNIPKGARKQNMLNQADGINKVIFI